MGVEVSADCGLHLVLFSRAIAEGMKDIFVGVFMGQWSIETPA